MEVALHWSGPWPDFLQPLLTALESLPEAAEAGDGQVVFCPDAAAMTPPAAGDAALFGLVPSANCVLSSTHKPALVAALRGWTERGAHLAVPTQSAAIALRSALSLPNDRVSVLSLPLPPQRIPPAAEPGGTDILALSPVNFGPVLTATEVLRLTGLEARLVIADPNAERFTRAGSIVCMYDLMPGIDVVETSDWRAAARSAGAIVLGSMGTGLGWTLREALATARPVLVPSEATLRDHLAEIGAAAYTYAHACDPRTLVFALAAALQRGRGHELERSARAAVLGESYEHAARRLYHLLHVAADVKPKQVSLSPGFAQTAAWGRAAAVSDAGPTLDTPGAEPAGAVAMLDRPAPAARVPEPPAHDGPPRLDDSPRIEVSQRLQVCVLNPNPSGGGGERFMRQLVGAMGAHDSGPRVKLVCQVDPNAAFDPGGDLLHEAGVELHPVTKSQFDEMAVREIEGSDVVYYTWPHRIDPPDTDAPVACTFHDLNWKHFDVISDKDKVLLERQTPLWIAKASAFVHSSKFIREELHHYYEAPRSLTHMIPTAADPPPKPVTEWEREYVRRRFALPERFLLSPNGYHLHKNYPALTTALRILRRDGRPVNVIATGMATELYNGPNLIGLGYVSARELQALYEESIGMVQTTLYEAGSFPMVEAMAAHKPVAISRIPPIEEQCERVGVVAELFDPLRPEAVAEALWRLWTGCEATDPRTIEANAQAVAERTWDDVAGDYLQLLASLTR